MAHAVVRRTNEIGIRMALGAERGHIIWLVLKESLLLVAIGVVIGVPAAWGGPAYLQSAFWSQSKRSCDASDGGHLANPGCGVSRLSAG